MSGVHLSITATTDTSGDHILTITVDNQTGGAIYISDDFFMYFMVTQGEGEERKTVQLNSLTTRMTIVAFIVPDHTRLSKGQKHSFLVKLEELVDKEIADIFKLELGDNWKSIINLNREFFVEAEMGHPAIYRETRTIAWEHIIECRSLVFKDVKIPRPAHYPATIKSNRLRVAP